jgi:uncharacterized membrane protein
METTGSTGLASVAQLQGGFWLTTGLWPIVHLRSFERVTGPKPEGWLVKTVGALIAVIGGTLLVAGRRRRLTPELQALGALSAGALAAVDVFYAGIGRIKPIYLADAAVELAFAAGWAALRGA